MEVYFMFTQYDFKDLIDKVNNQFDTLLSISHDENIEFGKAKDNTIHKFNALYFAMNEAAEILKKGLDGKFKWED